MLSSPERPSDQHGRHRGGGGERLALPGWLAWLQLSLSSMLVVLFLVLLSQSREQNRQLQRLEQRVQGLENSRALDRTTALEGQLRAMLVRLQSLERQGTSLAAAQQRLLEVEQQLREQVLQRRPARPALIEEPPAREPPGPPPPAEPITP
jgi:biopolymer transport protein ExbB/TolQ